MSESHPIQDFESSLTRLETLVEQMEQGDLTLDDALKAFEEGVRLTRQCQEVLSQAEQKVQILVEQQGQLQRQAFTESGSE
ncbi:exodeoxyribonuclease VII small subunit [Nitrincola tapanii]|uniref:Exodeoxyribonuclease 7 small subunit n=1 Tax=Nitrincola tapanii TaxID=1708751 RepID=A0A5A9W6G6_9GAMM|nr:exodeoxyribonuclease VII small subunit [Nitrincola tapanii]KAA0876306.1 exodeoxyribonuclease VII small subunit [Nitrincola tapanii]